MNTLELAHLDAATILEENGFTSRTLAETELPPVECVGETHYTVFGNREAPNVNLVIAPYLTPVDKPHYGVRMKAQQEVLGDDHAVIAIEAYNPATELTTRDQKALAAGNFACLSAGVFGVANHLQFGNYQQIRVGGYSLGADVAIQVAHDTVTNPNRGDLNLVAVQAIEPARVANRGGMRAMLAEASSGKDLFANIKASGVPALEEAWKINQEASLKKQKRALGSLVNTGLVGYMLLGPASNFALIRGFGTDASARQLNTIDHYDLPVVLGRMERSTVCPPEFLEKYKAPQFTTYTEPNRDHSADDNIIESAGRMLHFSRTIS